VGRATEFGRALAQRRMASRGTALGFLHVDGKGPTFNVFHKAVS
jgi:hypothetical protein